MAGGAQTDGIVAGFVVKQLQCKKGALGLLVLGLVKAKDVFQAVRQQAVATALALFVEDEKKRPLYAREADQRFAPLSLVFLDRSIAFLDAPVKKKSTSERGQSGGEEVLQAVRVGGGYRWRFGSTGRGRAGTVR